MTCCWWPCGQKAPTEKSQLVTNYKAPKVSELEVEEDIPNPTCLNTFCTGTKNLVGHQFTKTLGGIFFVVGFGTTFALIGTTGFEPYTLIPTLGGLMLSGASTLVSTIEMDVLGYSDEEIESHTIKSMVTMLTGVSGLCFNKAIGMPVR